jgi:hypothetical protein
LFVLCPFGNKQQTCSALFFILSEALPKNADVLTMSIINPHVHMPSKDAACLVYKRFIEYVDRLMFWIKVSELVDS